MKHLFFVSVAAGIFSGTSISATAQTSVNTVKFVAPQKKSVQFIEGIEVKREVTKPAEEVDLWAAPVKKSVVLDIPETVTAVPAKPARVFAAGGMGIENCARLQFKYAQLMDMEVEAINNIKLYEAIDEWWATRYRYGGTTKHGIDCSALTGALLRAGYGITPERTARAQYAQSEKISRDNLQEGDLVFFNTRGGISHVGLYLGNGNFVHSSVHSGVTISSLNDSYYGKKYIGGGRIAAE